MWKFVGSCGHTMDGYIREVDTHLFFEHGFDQVYQWDMYSLETGELTASFSWPLA
jgi:hypothetical protein